MKKLVLVLLVMVGVQAQAGQGVPDFVCKGTLQNGIPVTVTFDGWADNRQTARADVTIDIAGIGPRTTVDLYVGAGDSILGGGDYGVGTSSWGLEIYDYKDGLIIGEFTMGKNKPLRLACSAK